MQIIPRAVWANRTIVHRISPGLHARHPLRRSPHLAGPKKGALSVAITYDTGIALASVRKAESSLAMDIGTRKVARVADGAALSYSGLAADSRYDGVYFTSNIVL